MKHPGGHLGLVALWRAVDDPDSIGSSPQVRAHGGEAGAVQEASDGDERYDAFVGRMVLKDLPRRPTPEVDVRVVEVLYVGAGAPIARRDEGL